MDYKGLIEDMVSRELINVNILPGAWYIRVCRRGFLNKQWQVRFCDGWREVRLEFSGGKKYHEDFASGLLEQIVQKLFVMRHGEVD